TVDGFSRIETLWLFTTNRQADGAPPAGLIANHGQPVLIDGKRLAVGVERAGRGQALLFARVEEPAVQTESVVAVAASINQRIPVRPPGNRVSEQLDECSRARHFPLRPAARRHDQDKRLLCAG